LVASFVIPAKAGIQSFQALLTTRFRRVTVLDHCIFLKLTALGPILFSSFPADNILYPADEERIASYGSLTEIPNQMWGNLIQMLESDDAPNPQAVADADLKLIETPAGQRPLRTVVDPLTGGEAPPVMNKTSDQVQEQLLSAFGLAELLSVKESD
jgi:hypothetical protein